MCVCVCVCARARVWVMGIYKCKSMLMTDTIQAARGDSGQKYDGLVKALPKHTLYIGY